MLTTRFLTISAFLPLMAISAAAHAGSTITDKSYWPSAAKPAVHSEIGTVQSGPRDAFASSNMTASPRQTAAVAVAGANTWRYHGGPKSPF
jgi:hypothetical protein